MKLIIAGSRTLKIDINLIRFLVDHFKLNVELIQIVSGCAEGVDKAGEQYSDIFDIDCLVKKFPADWNKYGKAAGPIRNKQMAEYADTLLLIWDGKSKGSANMKFEMKKLNKPIYEVILSKS